MNAPGNRWGSGGKVKCSPSTQQGISSKEVLFAELGNAIVVFNGLDFTQLVFVLNAKG